MSFVAAGEVSGPNECIEYFCDGGGNVQQADLPMGSPCTQNGGTACDGNGTCDAFAVFDDPGTLFDGNSKFGP